MAVQTSGPVFERLEVVETGCRRRWTEDEKLRIRGGEPEAAHALAQVSSAEAMIAHDRLAIEKLKRALYGQRSERGERLGRVRRDLLDQLELQLEELEATATEDALVAETVDATTVRSAASQPPFTTQWLRKALLPQPSAEGYLPLTVQDR